MNVRKVFKKRVTLSNRILFIYGIAFLYIFFAENAQASSQDTINELDEDFHILFLISPKDSIDIINKYKINSERYLSLFKEILNSNEFDDNIIYNIIYLSGILKENRVCNEVIKLSDLESKKFKEVKSFYFYRINVDKMKHLNVLKKQLESLVDHPTDSYLITYLAFMENLNFSLKYLDRLYDKSDGIIGELVSWTINYLYFNNQENAQAVGMILKARCSSLIDNIE